MRSYIELAIILAVIILACLVSVYNYNKNQPQVDDIWLYCPSENPFNEMPCSHHRVLDVQGRWVQYEKIPNFNGRAGYRSESIKSFKMGAKRLEVAD